MNVVTEQNMINIKNKMTEIRRNRKGALFQNYYNNCESDHEIFTVYGKNTVVFWNNDDGVIRGYFYSSEQEELKDLLGMLPSGCVVDYLTKTKDDFLDFMEEAGLHLLHEMHRMSSAGMTEEDKKIVEENKLLMREVLYKPQNVRAASMEDMEVIYEKLYEIFDPRESHLPTKSELKGYIEKQWCSVYFEDGKLAGFHMFTVDKGAFYGYQIWNGTGPEGYWSLNTYSDYLYGKYLKENNIISAVNKTKPNYCWVNVKNRKSKRLVEFWGQKFDGLYDFVFEKLDSCEKKLAVQE